MGQKRFYIRQGTETSNIQARNRYAHSEDFVLEKSIFTHIFEKDIRRVFIYKKAERLAKATHLIAPAFAESVSLKNRVDAIAIALVDAAILPPGAARAALSHELLALSSVLAIARTSGMLSHMNAELITHEAHALLQEIAAYEEPRLSLDEAPTLSGIAKKALSKDASRNNEDVALLPQKHPAEPRPRAADKRQIKDIKRTPDGHIKDRQEAILSVIKNKRKASIKDISTFIRNVSEKTIQRELLSLIEAGIVEKQGERRWSTYSLLAV